MAKKIIGFAGRKRSGKTCIAKMLQQEENAIIITIADYLKFLCCELMNMSYEELNLKKDNGYTFDVIPDNRWFELIENKTHIGIENIKKEIENKHITNIRQLLQVIGTDVIRKYDEDWHVKQLVNTLENYSDDKLLVVDDVRFPNEKDAILKCGGEVFFIIRPNVTSVSNHISEKSLLWQDFDKKHIIINNKAEEFLKEEFLCHFKKNFNLNSKHSIFLYENEGYLKCSSFGYQYNKNDELLTQILTAIKEDTLFKNFGIIKFKTCSMQIAQRYIKEVDNSLKCSKTRCNEFITNNPLITENLKIYF